MSSLSIASNSTGFDALLFMTFGMLDSNSDLSNSDSRRVHRHEPHNSDGDGDIDSPEGIDGEAEMFEDDLDDNEGNVRSLHFIECIYT